MCHDGIPPTLQVGEVFFGGNVSQRFSGAPIGCGRTPMGKLKRSRYLPWNSAQVVHELHWFRRFLRQKLHASNWDIYELEGFHLQLRWNLRKAAGFFSLFISPFKPHIQFCWTTPKKITLKPTKSGRFAPRNSHCFQVMMTFGRQLWMWPSSRLGADRISTDGMEWNITLPEANSSHLKIHPWKFGDSYWKPSIVGATLVSGSVVSPGNKHGIPPGEKEHHRLEIPFTMEIC